MIPVKCPRCDLNYIMDGAELCTVCRREVRGETEPSDISDICVECGENPALPGGDLCIFCLKELNHGVVATSDEVIAADPVIEIDSVSTMDEIELDTNQAVFDEADDLSAEDANHVISLQALAEDDDEDDEMEDL